MDFIYEKIENTTAIIIIQSMQNTLILLTLYYTSFCCDIKPLTSNKHLTPFKYNLSTIKSWLFSGSYIE